MGSPAKDLDEGYRIAATLLKQLLKDQIDEEVDRTISQHLSDCLENSVTPGMDSGLGRPIFVWFPRGAVWDF